MQQYNAFTDHVEASRIFYNARPTAQNEAETKIFKQVEKHLRDQVVLRCCAMLEDPKNRDLLDELFDEAYSMLAMTQQVACNIRAVLYLTYSKWFPNGVAIVSNNLATATLKKYKRPGRGSREKEQQTGNQHEKGPMQMRIPASKATDTRCA